MIYQQLKYNHNLQNSVVLDLGANIGIEGEKIFNIFNSKALIMVEPVFSNVKTIYDKIISKNMIGKWFVENCAIDSKSGLSVMGYEDSPGMSGRANGSLDEFNWRNWNYQHSQIVRTKTINEICDYADIIKIDIERHEYNVLKDICKLKNTKIIFLELHAPCFDINLTDFLQDCLKGTNLEITGWFINNQSQTDNIESAIPTESVSYMPCGDCKLLVIEKKEVL